MVEAVQLTQWGKQNVNYHMDTIGGFGCVSACWAIIFYRLLRPLTH